MSFNMLDFRYDEIMNEAYLHIHSINNTQNSSSNSSNNIEEPNINNDNKVLLQNNVNTATAS